MVRGELDSNATMNTETDEAEEQKARREFRTAWLLVAALSEMCAADPMKTVDLLTGYLWDEEEAGRIKEANIPPQPHAGRR